MNNQYIRPLELLRHYRHDWLNHLQVIQGNLELNKVEHAKAMIDDIIRKSQHESQLSNLNIPDLSLYLLTFNWHDHWYTLDVEVMGKATDCSCYQKEWLNMLRSFHVLLDQAVNRNKDNHLLLTIQSHPSPYLELEFEGGIDHTHEIERWVNELSGEWKAKECMIYKEDFFIVISNQP